MSEASSVVESFMAAMRRGPEAEVDLLALFAPGASYAEPFSGLPPAVGIEQIRERFRLGWQDPPPDMELDVMSVEVVGDRAVTMWECRSSAFAAPAKGRDEYVFSDGRITSLHVSLLEGGLPPV